MDDMSYQQLEQHIVDLEIRLTLQEDTIQQLNDELFQQQKTTQFLEKQLRILAKKLQSITSSQLCDASEETPPPHY